jgi:hypothetical protein
LSAVRVNESGAPEKPFMLFMNGFHKEAQLKHLKQTANFARQWRVRLSLANRITKRDYPDCVRFCAGSVRVVHVNMRVVARCGALIVGHSDVRSGCDI